MRALLRTIVRLLRGARPEYLDVGGVDYVRVTRSDRLCFHLPDENPYMDDLGEERRWRAAQAIMDAEQTYGFVVVTIEKERPGSRVGLHTQISPEWWPVVEQTFARLLREARLMRAGDG